jgi:hypothetical protein
MPNRLIAYDPELEMFEGEGKQPRHSDGRVLGDTAEMSLAARLLETRDEADLKLFLGNLARDVAKTIGVQVSSAQADAIRDVLVGAIKQTLRQIGRTSRAQPVPFGNTVGSRLASIPSSQLGFELEGLSSEDREFETARRLVRFAAEAGKNAIAAGSREPVAAAWAGAAAAARRYAPGLLRALERQRMGAESPSADRLGRWIRSGDNVVVLNAQ